MDQLRTLVDHPPVQTLDINLVVFLLGAAYPKKIKIILQFSPFIFSSIQKCGVSQRRRSFGQQIRGLRSQISDCAAFDKMLNYC